MIAKVICWGDSRAEAMLRMRRALSEFRIMGVKTNVPFHQQLLASTRFQAGQFDTRFVEDRFCLGEEDRNDVDVAAIAATVVAHHQGQRITEYSAGDRAQRSRWKWDGH